MTETDEKAFFFRKKTFVHSQTSMLSAFIVSISVVRPRIGDDSEAASLSTQC
jgi:hypothetical protein